MLDLTDQTLSEDQLLLNLQKAFDAGETITGVRINSDTAKNLHLSPALELTTQGVWNYHCLFGTDIELITVSRRELNQVSIDTHNVDAIQ